MVEHNCPNCNLKFNKKSRLTEHLTKKNSCILINNENNLYHQLKILILNSCHVDLKIIECLLNRLPDLNELHLASNDYSIVTFTKIILN